MRARCLARRAGIGLAPLLLVIGCAGRANSGGSEPAEYTGLGIDPDALQALQVDEPWAVGDAVEYLLVLERDGRVRELHVEVELAETRPWSADMLVVNGTMNCPSEQPGESVTLSLLSTQATLAIGVWEAGQLVCHERAELDHLMGLAGQAQPSDCATAMISSLFELALEVNCLEDLLFQVVDRPSFGSILANGGRAHISVHGLSSLAHEPEDLLTPAGVLPTVRAEGRIEANGTLALEFRVWVTFLRPPLAVTSGVVRLEAWKPSDPRTRVSIALSGVRRGSMPVDVPEESLARLERSRAVERAKAALRQITLPPVPSAD